MLRRYRRSARVAMADLGLPASVALRHEREILPAWVDVLQLPEPFFCCSTNLARARLTVHETGSLELALRASAAMPGIFPPVSISGDLHTDGVLVNNLPADIARERAPGTTLAVDVVPRSDRVTRYRGDRLSAWAIVRDRLTRPERERSPTIADSFGRCCLMAALRHSQRIRHRVDCLIEPAVDRGLRCDCRGRLPSCRRNACELGKRRRPGEGRYQNVGSSSHR